MRALTDLHRPTANMATTASSTFFTDGNMSTVPPTEEFGCSLFNGDQHKCVSISWLCASQMLMSIWVTKDSLLDAGSSNFPRKFLGDSDFP